MLTLNIPYPLVQKYFQWEWHPSWCNYRNVLANTWETTTYLSKYQKKSTVRCVTFKIVRHPFEKSLIFLSIIQPVKSLGYNFTYLQTYRNTLSGHLRELKNNGKVQLRELFITKYESQFKRGSTKVIVTRVVARRTSTVPLLVGGSP